MPRVSSPPPHDDATQSASEHAAATVAAEAADAAEKPQRGIQSLDVTGDLLAALVAAGTPLPLRDLAAAAGMADHYGMMTELFGFKTHADDHQVVNDFISIMMNGIRPDSTAQGKS